MYLLTFDKKIIYYLKFIDKSCKENALFGFGKTFKEKNNINIIINKIIKIPPDHLITQSKKRICIEPTLLIKSIKYCNIKNCSFIIIHTHPYDKVKYSPNDINSEYNLMSKVVNKVPNNYHAFLIIGNKYISGKIWGENPIKNFLIDNINVYDSKKVISLTNDNYQFNYTELK